MWISLKKVIPAKIKFLGIEKEMELMRLQKEWDDLVEGSLGILFKKKSKIVNKKSGILIVDCLNSVWASEFQMKEERLLKDIGQRLKKTKIEKIRFIN